VKKSTPSFVLVWFLSIFTQAGLKWDLRMGGFWEILGGVTGVLQASRKWATKGNEKWVSLIFAFPSFFFPFFGSSYLSHSSSSCDTLRSPQIIFHRPTFAFVRELVLYLPSPGVELIAGQRSS